MEHTPNDTVVCFPVLTTMLQWFLGTFVQTGLFTEKKKKKIGCRVSISTTKKKEARDIRNSLKILFSSDLYCLT